MSAAIRVRGAARMEDLAIDGAPALDVAGLLDDGTTRLEHCFVVSRDGVDVGRVGVSIEPTCPAELLGRLPPREANLFGLELPWTADDVDVVGRALLDAAIARVARDEDLRAQAFVNTARNDHAAVRVRVLEASGARLFQEKQGFTWTRGEGAPPPPSSRLVFRTLDEVGFETYRRTLGRAGEGTIDRNDAWYRELAGEENWSRVFMTFYAPEADARSWLLATLPDDREARSPVGMVAVSAFDDDTATVTFIGVVPEHRGKGYVDDLLRAGTVAAAERGFGAMLSDADVQNLPMIHAFVRNGHRADARPWHKWHYRF